MGGCCSLLTDNEKDLNLLSLTGKSSTSRNKRESNLKIKSEASRSKVEKVNSIATLGSNYGEDLNPRNLSSRDKVFTTEVDDFIVKPGHKLVLVILESSDSTLENEKVLITGMGIMFTGVNNFLPSKSSKDVYIFGSGKGTETENENDIDYILPSDFVHKRHFLLKFDPIRHIHKIKPIDNNSVYFRILGVHKLNYSSVIFIGCLHIMIEITFDLDDNDTDYIKSEIKLTLVKNSDFDSSIEFRFKSNEKPRIRVGNRVNMANAEVEAERDNLHDLDINITEEGISKTHCILIYENNNWYIVDGDGENTSTNGVWVLITDTMELFNNTVLRVGSCVFKAISN